VSVTEKVKDKLFGHKDHGTATHTDGNTTHTHSSYSTTTHDGYGGANYGSATHNSASYGSATHGGGLHTNTNELYCPDHSCHEYSPCAKHPEGSRHVHGSHHSSHQHSAGHVHGQHHAAGSHVHGAAGVVDTRNEVRLTLAEEQLAVGKREVGAGGVDIHKRVEVEHVQETVGLRREEIVVERRPLTGDVGNLRIGEGDAHIRVPLYREEAVVEKVVVPKEEVIIRKKEVIDRETVGADLRSEYAEVDKVVQTTHTDVRSGYADARDTNRDGHVSVGEKLKAEAVGNHNAGPIDSRDTNRDGHVSLGEKIKGAVSR